MGRRKRRYKNVLRCFCYYCDRDFDDEKVLILHQKAKHFKCTSCNRKLDTAAGLVIHMSQVHKMTISKVPNSLDDRCNPDIILHGMEGVPQEVIEFKLKQLNSSINDMNNQKRQRQQWTSISVPQQQQQAAPTNTATTAFYHPNLPSAVQNSFAGNGAQQKTGAVQKPDVNNGNALYQQLQQQHQAAAAIAAATSSTPAAAVAAAAAAAAAAAVMRGAATSSSTTAYPHHHPYIPHNSVQSPIHQYPPPPPIMFSQQSGVYPVDSNGSLIHQHHIPILPQPSYPTRENASLLLLPEVGPPPPPAASSYLTTGMMCTDDSVSPEEVRASRLLGYTIK